MPDHPIPGNWTEAFAALPQDAPPAHGWERLQARMQAEVAITRRPGLHGRAKAWIGLAVAATLVLAATLWERRESYQPLQPAPQPRLAAQPAVPERNVGQVPQDRNPEVAATQPAADRAPGERRRGVHATVSARPVAAVAKPEPAPLRALYAESAQLEALLGLARDDRVSSAGAALLGDALDAQVAAIDAALSQAGLDDGERLRLWQARVDALRQAAGFESTQRLLASQGRSDVMLVSVD